MRQLVVNLLSFHLKQSPVEKHALLRLESQECHPMTWSMLTRELLLTRPVRLGRGSHLGISLCPHGRALAANNWGGLGEHLYCFEV